MLYSVEVVRFLEQLNLNALPLDESGKEKLRIENFEINSN